MSAPFVAVVSRQFAAGLCLREGALQPLDLALWLGGVATALTIVDEPDADGLTTRDRWLVAEDDAVPIWMAGRTILGATGLRGHHLLERPFERLREARVSIGLATDASQLWHGWEASPPSRENPREVGLVSGLMLAVGMIHETAFPVAVNLSALARFRSRFSTLLYLRGLAWMAGAGTPKAWGRTKPGSRVTVTVPIGELHHALGTDALVTARDWNAKAFGAGGRGGAVHADLATAGIRLSTEWVMGPGGYGASRAPAALRLTVSRIAGAERRPLLRRPRRSQASTSDMSASSAP